MNLRINPPNKSLTLPVISMGHYSCNWRLKNKPGFSSCTEIWDTQVVQSCPNFAGNWSAQSTFWKPSTTFAAQHVRRSRDQQYPDQVRYMSHVILVMLYPWMGWYGQILKESSFSFTTFWTRAPCFKRQWSHHLTRQSRHVDHFWWVGWTGQDHRVYFVLMQGPSWTLMSSGTSFKGTASEVGLVLQKLTGKMPGRNVMEGSYKSCWTR